MAKKVTEVKAEAADKSESRGQLMAGVSVVLTLVVGQVAAFLLAPEAWRAFVARLPVILAMIAFWGPVVALLSGAFVYITLRVLGFTSMADIRAESVDQNNPAPAIIFVGTLIASILFLMLVIRP